MINWSDDPCPIERAESLSAWRKPVDEGSNPSAPTSNRLPSRAHPFLHWQLPRVRPSLGELFRGTGTDILHDRRLDQGAQRRSIDQLTLPYVDGASRVSLETGVEEPPRILQGCTAGEGKLDNLFVSLPRADNSSVGPDQRAPLPLLRDVRVRLVDDAANFSLLG